MPEEFAPRRHHSSDPPDAVSGVGAQPGKKAPTDRLSTRSTGVPVVDDGMACDRGEEGADCFLTTEQRTRILVTMSGRAGIVGANAHAGCQSSRTDVLIEHEETWGPLAEFVYYTPSGAAIGGIIRIMKTNGLVKHVDNVAALATNASRGFRKTMMGTAAAAGNHQKASKAHFIDLIGDEIGPWQKNIVEVIARGLDDAGLVALNDALDPGQLTRGYFVERITEMVGRYEGQKIDQVGINAIYRHGELAYIGHGPQRRLVMLEDFGLHNTAGTGTGSPKPRDLTPKLDDHKKQIVIDRDLEPMALAFYAERTGRRPVEMDVEAGLQAGGALASDVLDDLLSLGGGVK